MQTNNKTTILFELNAVDIAQFTINPYSSAPLKREDFEFSIQVEQKTDSANKLIQVMVIIQVLLQGKQDKLASLSVLCDFYITNYDEALTMTSEESSLVTEFNNTISSISISTSRGVLFTLLKGTYLHQAILPVFSLLKPKTD
jgi:hypothetical protein